LVSEEKKLEVTASRLLAVAYTQEYRMGWVEAPQAPRGVGCREAPHWGAGSGEGAQPSS